jgi:hypothetical protein
LEVVVGEFYEQAGSLFVEAYDAFAFGGKADISQRLPNNRDLRVHALDSPCGSLPSAIGPLQILPVQTKMLFGGSLRSRTRNQSRFERKKVNVVDGPASAFQDSDMKTILPGLILCVGT